MDESVYTKLASVYTVDRTGDRCGKETDMAQWCYKQVEDGWLQGFTSTRRPRCGSIYQSVVHMYHGAEADMMDEPFLNPIVIVEM